VKDESITKRADMLVADKNAVTYGAGGAIGSAVACAFARERDTSVSDRPHPRPSRGRRQGSVAEGGAAEAAQVDALDEHAIEDHLAAVIATNAIDVSFEAISAQTPSQEVRR
jgi:NAD(P)-dependent dehydrogenase (short-subunit alcohol dehydrogenase family)